MGRWRGRDVGDRRSVKGIKKPPEGGYESLAMSIAQSRLSHRKYTNNFFESTFMQIQKKIKSWLKDGGLLHLQPSILANSQYSGKNIVSLSNRQENSEKKFFRAYNRFAFKIIIFVARETYS